MLNKWVIYWTWLYKILRNKIKIIQLKISNNNKIRTKNNKTQRKVISLMFLNFLQKYQEKLIWKMLWELKN